MKKNDRCVNCDGSNYTKTIDKRAVSFSIAFFSYVLYGWFVGSYGLGSMLYALLMGLTFSFLFRKHPKKIRRCKECNAIYSYPDFEYRGQGFFLRKNTNHGD